MTDQRFYWRKSSRSAHNGNCVEVASIPQSIAVRDSTLANGEYPYLAVATSEWMALLAGVKSGDITD